MKKIITSLSSALLILAASLSLTGVAKSAEFFTIGTGGPTGVYFQTGNAICKMLHKSAIAKEHGRKKGIDKAYRCTAPSTGGSNYNIGQIAAGEFQFGVAQSDWQYHAFNGSSKWEGKQYKGLRAVFSVHNEPFQIWARKKARIKDFAGLKGKVVNIGNPTEYPNASILPSQRAFTCSEEVSSVVALNILISAPIAFINSSIVPL